MEKARVQIVTGVPFSLKNKTQSSFCDSLVWRMNRYIILVSSEYMFLSGGHACPPFAVLSLFVTDAE